MKAAESTRAPWASGWASTRMTVPGTEAGFPGLRITDSYFARAWEPPSPAKLGQVTQLKTCRHRPSIVSSSAMIGLALSAGEFMISPAT